VGGSAAADVARCCDSTAFLMVDVTLPKKSILP
jgi:hypothetical protein